MQTNTQINSVRVVTARAAQQAECDFCHDPIEQGADIRLMMIDDVELGKNVPKIRLHPDCLKELGVQLIRLA